MANPIQLKRSKTKGNVPASLADGEVGINHPDRLLFVNDGAGVVRTVNLTSDAEKLASTQPIGSAMAGKFDKTGGTVAGAVTAGDPTLQYPLGVALAEAAVSGNPSRRATMNVGSAWQIGQDTYANGTKDFFLYGTAGAGLAFSVDPATGVFAHNKAPTAGGLPTWTDLGFGDSTARLNMAGINLARRTLESFGPCGNGNVTEDHAAFTAAQAWCLTRNTCLVLTAGKRYLLDFSFTIYATGGRLFAPKFRLEAWGAEVLYSGTGAAFLYQGAWFVDKQQQEYCSFEGGVFAPTDKGTQTAISVSMKYNPSQWFKSCDIFCVEGRCDDMNNQNVRWNTFISLNNCWNSSIFGVVANQPFSARQGVMISVAGLSAALRVFHCNGSWWDTGLYFGYASLVGLKGANGSGTFLSGEMVTGSKSGTKAYVCQASPMSQNGVTYGLIVDGRFGGTGDFDQGGETITGATTGATFTLAATGTALLYVPGETVYASGGEFVDVNTGFNFDGPAAPGAGVRNQIGHQINNWHVNSRAYGVLVANCFQVLISGALLYALQTGWVGVYVNGSSQVTLTSACEIHGQGYDNTYGVLFNGGCVQCRMDPLILYCRYGVNVPDGNQQNNDFGFSFGGCITDINNGGPVLSAGTAGGNSWYRTVSRQATFVGGYNK